VKKFFTLLLVSLICSYSFAQSNITMELKDAPVRTSLEMIFKQAGIKSYVIENSVSGSVSMNLTDHPFENSLKLVMRANTIPLTYTKENDVYIVKSRKIVIGPNPDPNFDLLVPYTRQDSITWNVIKTNYIDPFDLQSVLGNILFINQFSRFTGGMNGMGGGAMGGFGGGQGGGMNGGMGGFGGGRNF
jgi:hypothetical protein